MKINDLIVPDEYFKVANFSTRMGCSVACAFCPQKALMSNYKSSERLLTRDNFIKAISNIKGSPVKSIGFGSFSEPLENENFYDFVNMAFDNGYGVDISTTLKNLSIDGLKKIKDRDIFYGISIQPIGINNRYGLPDEEAWGNIRKFFELNPKGNIHLWCVDNNLSDDDKEILNKRVERYTSIKIEYNKITSRGGIITNLGNTPLLKQKSLVCKLFLGPVILPNGDITICCNDFSLKHISGNIYKQTLNEIIYGDFINNFIKIMYGEKMGDILCHSCDYASIIPNNNNINLYYYILLTNFFKKYGNKIIPNNGFIRGIARKLFHKLFA